MGTRSVVDGVSTKSNRKFYIVIAVQILYRHCRSSHLCHGDVIVRAFAEALAEEKQPGAALPRLLFVLSQKEFGHAGHVDGMQHLLGRRRIP